MDLHDGIAAEPKAGVDPSEQDCDDCADCSAVDEYAHRALKPCIFPAHDEQLGGSSHEKQGDREVDGRRMQFFQGGDDAGIALISMATSLVMASTCFVVRG